MKWAILAVWILVACLAPVLALALLVGIWGEHSWSESRRRKWEWVYRAAYVIAILTDVYRVTEAVSDGKGQVPYLIGCVFISQVFVTRALIKAWRQAPSVSNPSST